MAICFAGLTDMATPKHKSKVMKKRFISAGLLFPTVAWCLRAVKDLNLQSRVWNPLVYH